MSQRIKKISSEIIVLLLLIFIAGCKNYEFVDVDYAPQEGDSWDTTAPENVGLDREALDQFYSMASYCETIFSILVIKDEYLIAEHNFNDSSTNRKERLQSVTKSFTSALVGIALEQGFISSIEQKVIEFFPEISITDPRKKQITIKDMLEMRTGYPSEETDKNLWDGLLSGHYPELLEEFPLVNYPGTKFHYSNLTSNWLGIIVDRASGMHLKDFAQEYLFSKMKITAGEWGTDADGHNNGCGDLFLTARDAGKLGLLYLNDGVYKGNRIISSDWVKESLKTYSVNENIVNSIGDFHDIGYGYHWWSAHVGKHYINFAWGHGGQLIVLVDELNMVIVTTAYPFWLEHNDKSWKNEKAIITLVSRFISSLFNE